MIVPPEQRLNFFVYVLESPSALDLYHDRAEGDHIGSLLKLLNIPFETHTLSSKALLVYALDVGLREAEAKRLGRRPIVHISCHGNGDGIGFTDGGFIAWDELRELLKPVNARNGRQLILCMSSCDGYSGVRMAMETRPEAEHPFFVLIGPSGTPTWPQTAVAFTTLYYQLVAGVHVTEATNAMKAASMHTFLIQWGSQARQDYCAFIAGVEREAARLSPPAVGGLGVPGGLLSS